MNRARTIAAMSIFTLPILSLAAIPPAFDPRSASLDLELWGFAVGASAVGVVCAIILMARMHPLRLAEFITACCLAALAPLAVESIARRPAADVALAAAILSATIASAARCGRISQIVAMLLAGVGGSLDLTALLVIPAFVDARARSRCIILLLGAMAGAAISFALHAWPIVAVRFHEAAFPIHRDVLLLLPVVMIGWAGWIVRSWITPACRRVRPAAGVIGLLLVLLGLPLQARLCAIPLFLMMPEGLRSLWRFVHLESRARRLGLCFTVMLLLLAVLEVRAWAKGPLLLLYLLG